MTDDIVQPEDEAPLLMPQDSDTVKRILDLLSSARTQIDQSAGSVAQEFEGILSDAHSQLDAAMSDIDFALIDIIQDGIDQLDESQSNISRQVTSQVNALNNDVNAVVDNLFNAGAIPPVTMTQINADLNSTDPTVFERYFPDAFGPVVAPVNQFQPLPIPGQPVAGVHPAQQPIPAQPPQPGQVAQQPVQVGGQVILPGQPIPQPGQQFPDAQQFVPPFLQGGIPTRQPPVRPPRPATPPSSTPITAEPPIIPPEPIPEPPVIDLTQPDGTPQPAPEVTPQPGAPVTPPGPTPPIAPATPAQPPIDVTAGVGLDVCLIPPDDIVTEGALPWQWRWRHWAFVRCKPGCPIEVIRVQSVSVPTAPAGYHTIGPRDYVVTDDEIRLWVYQTGCPYLPQPGQPLGGPLPEPEPEPGAPGGEGEEPGPVEAPPPGMVAWDRVDVCKQSEDLCDRFRDIARGEIEFPFEGDGSIAASVVKGIAGFVTTLGDVVTQITTASVQGNPGAATFHLTSTMLTSLAAHWLGMPTDYYSLWNTYTFQRCNPKRIPEQSEIDRMYLSHEFTTAEWKCFTQAHGNMEHWRERYVNTLWRQMSPGELVDLYRRKEIKEPEFDKALKLHGYEDAQDARKKLLAVTAQTLTYSDLERCVVRDAFDNDVATRYNLDKDLDRKFDGIAKEYADKIGLPHDVIKYLWRAHWKYPSDTAIYDLIHLFPPDRPEVLEWAQNQGALAAAGGAGALGAKGPIVFTLDDARRILEINDLAPELIDAMILRSYHPINTSDGVRAYQAGYFTEEDLYWVYRRNGYDDKNSRLMSKFAGLVRTRMIANSTGVWTMRKIIKSYKYGEIRRDQAMSLMSSIMPDTDVQVRLLDGADLELVAEKVRECVKGLRRRFMLGEFGSTVAAGLLLSAGMAPDKIPTTIERWECERAHRRKEPRVTMLCGWYANRIIDADEYYERLTRLGYSATDASRIAGACHNSQVVKDATRAAQQSEKARREFIAEQRRQAKELKAYEKEAQEEYAKLTEAIEQRRAELAELLDKPPLPKEFPHAERNGD